jgi:hypothetical protein
MRFTTSSTTASTARAVPGIWVHTTLDSFNVPAESESPGFLPRADRARLESIRQARMLLDGRHREFFLDEGRTQFDFPQVRAAGRLLPLYLTYNVLALISLKGADLLFGDEPIVRATNRAQQQAVDALAERCGLQRLLYGCALDASAEGECFLETCAHAGEVFLRQVPADEIFPLCDPQPDGQYAAYVRRRIRNAGTEDAPLLLLLEVTYFAGRIERRCFQIDPEGRERIEVALEAWREVADESPAPTATQVEDVDGNVGRGADGRFVSLHPAPRETLASVTFTGVLQNTITWIPNLLIRGLPVSDYDGAIELQDALNAKNSQVGRVLLKHSDPRLAFPEESFDEQGNVRSDHEVFAFHDPHRIPRYITWDAELQHAMADRAFILNQLLVRTETSPALLGMKEGAAPEAYKKVRLESFNSLSKAARKAAFWKAGLRRAIGVAQAHDNPMPGGLRYERGPLGVQLRDGIPLDELDRANRLKVLRDAGLISLERALQEELQDPSAVEKELAQLARERDASKSDS